MQKNYSIAFCDILGFSNLVKNLPLDRLVKDNLGWFRKSLSHSIHKKDFPQRTPSIRRLKQQTSLGVAWFSDTILLYTLDDTDECLQSLISTLGWLLFENMLAGKTRLRCGVSYGEAYLDSKNSIYVGKPIIEAYHLEEQQVWSGGALTEATVNRVPPIGKTGRVAEWWLQPYHIPLKDNKHFKTLAIDWTRGVHPGPLWLNWSKNSPVPTEDDWKNQPNVCEIWQNTKKFHDECCGYCS